MQDNSDWNIGDVADDFFVNLNLETTLALPENRETVLHFCEAAQKEFGDMSSFYRRDSGEFVLEGDREAGSYRWMELHTHHLTAGYFNPMTVQEAYRMHAWLLERSVYYLGVSGLDVECLDVSFGFNLNYEGNRDEIVAQALLGGSPLGSLAFAQTSKTIECQPSLVIGLDEDCCLQARLSLETHSSTFQVRTGRYEDEPISIYLTVRRYPGPGKVINLKEDFTRMCRTCEDIASRMVIPQIVRPIASAISSES